MPPNAVYVSKDGLVTFDEYGRKLDSLGNVAMGDYQSLRGADARPIYREQPPQQQQQPAAPPQRAQAPIAPAANPWRSVTQTQGQWDNMPTPVSGYRAPQQQMPMQQMPMQQMASDYTTQMDQLRQQGQPQWRPPYRPQQGQGQQFQMFMPMYNPPQVPVYNQYQPWADEAKRWYVQPATTPSTAMPFDYAAGPQDNGMYRQQVLPAPSMPFNYSYGGR